ncbi:DinB family protein [Kurthia sibirica]|uniref:DinB-like domain-containing protein n=1 Tax=Kurthia sibirica TaxID=202750 RepID=A0A2U3AN28_9BACL|nr:DinB family protein [Kurthia sibirica]PWI25932.1 hypothetical protein DEX24_05210 [Kurthia sibirica]GEK35136.1 hypothetical protein KSI01_26690 [Kurthia sibirica]
MNDITAQLIMLKQSITVLLENVTEETMYNRPIPHKRSILELINHISCIPAADVLLSQSVSHQEIDAYYHQNWRISLPDIVNKFQCNMDSMIHYFQTQSVLELEKNSTSYWGAVHSQKGWALQIIEHLVHHRAQLHMYLDFSGTLKKIQLFD